MQRELDSWKGSKTNQYLLLSNKDSNRIAIAIKQSIINNNFPHILHIVESKYQKMFNKPKGNEVVQAIIIPKKNSGINVTCG